MMASTSPRGIHNGIGLVILGALAVLLAGCATTPVVRTRTALGVSLSGAHTFAYVKHPGTDTGPYSSLTTQALERDVTQQMLARGYALAPAGVKPDLLVDFRLTRHDRVEGGFGPVGYWGYGWGGGWGWGGPYGPGWGWGWGCCGPAFNDVHTVTRAALTITIINAPQRLAVWSGTTASEVTPEVRNQPDEALSLAVSRIFSHYPMPASR